MRRAVAIVLVALLAVSCTEVYVTNLAESAATVRITLPDTPAGYTRVIQAGRSTSTFSQFGGTVTVTVLPSEQYRQILKDLARAINERLGQPGVSGEDLDRLMDQLDLLNDSLKELAEQEANPPTCSARVSDFGTVTAIVIWDSTSNNWQVTCSATEA